MSTERLLQTILDSVEARIAVVDEDGDALLMNRTQRRIHAPCSPEGVEDPGEPQLLLCFPGTATPIPAEQRRTRRSLVQESFGNDLVDVSPAASAIMSLCISARQILDRHVRRAGAVVVFSDMSSYLESGRSQEKLVAEVSMSCAPR